jgi:hypothetical protein
VHDGVKRDKTVPPEGRVPLSAQTWGVALTVDAGWVRAGLAHVGMVLAVDGRGTGGQSHRSLSDGPVPGSTMLETMAR